MGSSLKPPDIRPRTDSIGGHSDTSSISTRQKRKRTSDGEETLIENPCDVFLQIENHIIEIQEAFLARNRKEKCKEALDAVPGTLELIRQLVLQFTNENSFLKGKVATLEAQLSRPALPRQKTFAAVAQGLSAKQLSQQQPQVAKLTPKPKRTSNRRQRRWTRWSSRSAANPTLRKLLSSSKLQEHGLTASNRDVSISWPRLANFDVPNSFSEDTTLEALAAQNGDSLDNRSVSELRALVKFKFKRGSKDLGKTSCLINEADPSIREALLKAKEVYLGTMRCRVCTFNLVTVCYKCEGLHHTSTLCKENLFAANALALTTLESVRRRPSQISARDARVGDAPMHTIQLRHARFMRQQLNG
ncbi:unnamed protein product [Trichogramma brassicae]|uniref:Uncharacterized protein n=1 Tax=Trichogramma brassicae TaxID=86971 RepID=A0A6H5ICK2_9HYME|nr:unnamed protein product [Trichogramma brassicae]